MVVTGCQENKSCRKVLNFLERLVVTWCELLWVWLAVTWCELLWGLAGCSLAVTS